MPGVAGTRLMSGTLLAFDFGTKSIGVAVGQRITGTARPLPAIKAQDGTPDWNIIERLLKEWQPDEIIVGLPLNMDGTEQPLTARARKFANRIHGRFGVEVKLHDERLSTVEARSGLFEQGGYRALNKGKVDSASAVIILESYFEQGILRRFTSAQISDNVLVVSCWMRRKRLIQPTVSANSKLRFPCRPDKLAHRAYFNSYQTQQRHKAPFFHPLLITLLKRYHPHLLPVLNNMR